MFCIGSCSTFISTNNEWTDFLINNSSNRKSEKYIPIEEKITAELIFNSQKTTQQFSQYGRRTHQLQGTCALIAELVCIGVLYRSL